MSIEENKALVRRFYEQVYKNHNLDLGVSMLSRDYEMHDPMNDFSGGANGWRRINASYWNAFPDQVVTVRGQVAEGDVVTTCWTSSGTDSEQGSGAGHRPDGNFQSRGYRSPGSSTAKSQRNGLSGSPPV